jgi:hypothetical protein
MLRDQISFIVIIFFNYYYLVVNKQDIEKLRDQLFTVDRNEIAKRIKDHKIGKRRIVLFSL